MLRGDNEHHHTEPRTSDTGEKKIIYFEYAYKYQGGMLLVLSMSLRRNQHVLFIKAVWSSILFSTGQSGPWPVLCRASFLALVAFRATVAPRLARCPQRRKRRRRRSMLRVGKLLKFTQPAAVQGEHHTESQNQPEN